MRFLGYTLANEADTPTEPPRPELYEEMGKFVEEAVKAGVIVATGGIAPTVGGRQDHPEGRRVHRRRRALHRGEGARRRLGAHGVPRQGRGHRVVQALRQRARRGRGPGPPRHRERRIRPRRPVVESVACRPPIRPPRSRRSSGWSSPGWSPPWRAFVGDIGLAEELAQDALVDALRQWPRDGTPRNPGRLAHHRGQAQGRRPLPPQPHAEREVRPARAANSTGGRHGPQTRRSTSTPESKEEIADDRLRLMFVACHPVLSVPARTALTLRLVGGLTVPEIARAYVVPEPTIAQRIVRAKRTIAKAGVPFEVPAGADRSSPPGVGAPGRSTSSTTRGTRPPPATTGCGPSSVPRRSGSAGCSPPWRRRSPRSTAWSP